MKIAVDGRGRVGQHDVAEAGGARVDRADPERVAGRVGQPRGERVAEPQVARLGEHVADRDRVAADAAQLAAVTPRSSAGCPWPGGRRRATARCRRTRSRRDRSPSSRVTATSSSGVRSAVVSGIGAPSRPTRTNGAFTRSAVTGLGVALPADLDDALRPGEHRDEHDRGGQRGRPPAVGGEAGARPAARTRRSAGAGGRAARWETRAGRGRAGRPRPPGASLRGSRTRPPTCP